MFSWRRLKIGVIALLFFTVTIILCANLWVVISTEDKVLTLKAFVVAIGVASGLATVALGLSKSERCGKDLPIQQQQHSLFSQASWGKLEMKPERNKFKVQAH